MKDSYRQVRHKERKPPAAHVTISDREFPVTAFNHFTAMDLYLCTHCDNFSSTAVRRRHEIPRARNKPGPLEIMTKGTYQVYAGEAVKDDKT